MREIIHNTDNNIFSHSILHSDGTNCYMHGGHNNAKLKILQLFCEGQFLLTKLL